MDQENPQIILTEKAAQVFKDACAAENHALEQSLLRVSARPGGCSGYKYELDWSPVSEITATDLEFFSNGVRIIVDRYYLEQILGSVEIDYADKNLMEQGFIFKQLNYGHQCGCGESFVAVKDLNGIPA
ncbi:MAG: iron-sulfur cluster assembly accessory protein [SAR324 cluster bacterium]|nr:iron-sulfur cluster assembly accessory protein [SAR324 cluster bacterium]